MIPRIILIGPCGGGSIPKNGASAKNYHLLRFLRDKNLNITTIDTENWRKNPFVLVRLFIMILCNPRAKYIVATNNLSSYRTFRWFSLFPRKRSIIHWVIGGTFADHIKNGRFKKEVFNVIDWILVEGKKMQRTYNELGFTDNVLYVPNFKKISYIPQKSYYEDGLVRFVFLSRIIPMKGCDIILQAVEKLNLRYQEQFIVDFYGPIEDDYNKEFMQKVNTLPNVEYRGFIDLRNEKNYDILANYDSMLFPTFWDGEGFPGVIIDAYIAGLPVIASDWSLNSDIIEDGKTGLIIDVKSVDALVSAMQKMLENRGLIREMSQNSSACAMKYEMKNVVSDELLKKIGLII